MSLYLDNMQRWLNNRIEQVQAARGQALMDLDAAKQRINVIDAQSDALQVEMENLESLRQELRMRDLREAGNRYAESPRQPPRSAPPLRQEQAPMPEEEYYVDDPDGPAADAVSPTSFPAPSQDTIPLTSQSSKPAATPPIPPLVNTSGGVAPANKPKGSIDAKGWLGRLRKQ